MLYKKLDDISRTERRGLEHRWESGGRGRTRIPKGRANISGLSAQYEEKGNTGERAKG